MKTLKSISVKLFVLVIIATLFLASQFTSPSANENVFLSTSAYPVPDSQFIVGAFHNGVDTDYTYQGQLNLNTWHHYTGPYWGWLSNALDHYDNDISLYQGLVTSKINQNNNQKGMRTLMDRPIIQYLVGGQRIDYQCENIAANFQADPYWFYAYNYSLHNNVKVDDINDNNPRYGNGERVKWCKIIEQNPLSGYLLIDSGLRANREMSFNETNEWMRDSTYEWYVMPRLRIDSAYAADGSHYNDTICKIIVTGWKGEIEAEFGLSVKNFKKNIDSTYNGNYLDSYYLDNTEILKYLKIDKSTLKNFRDTTIFAFNWDTLCNCDIKIYWTGKCDMWIDRVRIENRPAHEYLTQKDTILISKVDAEINWANTNNQIPNYFYFEECQMSHFPAIKELNRQITTGSGNKNELVIWLNYDLFKAHVPFCWSYLFDAPILKKYLYDDYGLRNIVMGSYALEGYMKDSMNAYRISYHPNTLSSSDYSKRDGILSYALTPSAYDTWLQEHIDDPINLSGVNYSYISKLMFSLSKDSMKVLNCPQAHLWYSSGHKLKEPSNEELELEANLALTNNAKGVIWFSYVCDWTTIGSDYYARGIMNIGNPAPVPRDSNVYQQNKYLKICKIDSMLSKRGPFIMSFNPALTKNCIYRNSDERFNFLSNTYFYDIVTYKPGNTTLNPDCNEDNPGESNPPNLVYECKAYRYLQAATFQTNDNDINKYFMIVNRRCSPFKDFSCEDSLGGKRDIRVKFDANSSEFANYNNWNIIDIDNKDTVVTFDKRAGALLDLGWYNPGQGKLYKISPVFPNGGTLVADEVISGNVNCNGMIYNGGHNITISPNAVVTFSENAGIEMNGGCFVSGVNADNAVAVTLTGKSSSTFWKGVTLIGCDSIGVYNTNISNIKANDTAKAFSIINSYKVNLRRNNITANSNSGGIQAVYNSFSDNPIVFNVRECTFNMNYSGYSAISVLSNASVTLPIVTEWCMFNSQNDTSNAIMFNEVTGGAIKNNTFTNFGKSVVLMYSAINL